MEISQERQEHVQWLVHAIQPIVCNLVDEPDAVRIEVVHGEQTSVLNLFCAQADLGKVIGKQGRNAESLRTLLKAFAAKRRVRAVIEIVDAEHDQRRGRS